MPAKLEDKLKREAREKGLSGKKADAYVFGTLRKTGWSPKKEVGNEHVTSYPQVSSRRPLMGY